MLMVQKTFFSYLLNKTSELRKSLIKECGKTMLISAKYSLPQLTQPIECDM